MRTSVTAAVFKDVMNMFLKKFKEIDLTWPKETSTSTSTMLLATRQIARRSS
ncbi:Hypothetical protein FKW44_022331 [Caligus rogercresseyi]|uniref:Uncharacterized protein n=1 Tax=Caligus rogercresseyi TaxID=217165 RepID=A0A7T8GSK7_CALRO|nr:Hypothetical protein FKW44_022331 [Caligus rogercresseyi]